MTNTTAPAIDLTELITQTSTALSSADTDAATVRFGVQATLAAGTNTQVEITAGKHEFTIDEPPALGGENVGANPVEHLLAALAACQVITVKVWAAKLGLAVDDVKVELAGPIDLRGFLGVDADVRPGFGQIEVTTRILGPEPAEAYDELIRKVEAHCPVLDNLTAGVPVRTTITAG
ncbi:OsmC family protein [Ruania zhangjianzhongii]|uniref:OsmC family protein n=1 Tax=Ruania zhangjianzhongii TaxID=2603206 RepID=UPI0011CCC59D|nr:OsmC family protein [Ruania zhangjianzhongii]